MAYLLPQIHRFLVQLVHSARHLLDVYESHIPEDVLEVLIPFFSSDGIMGSIKSRRLLTPEPLINGFANDSQQEVLPILPDWLSGELAVRKVDDSILLAPAAWEMAFSSHSGNLIVARESWLGRQFGRLVGEWPFAAPPSTSELHLVFYG